MATLKQVIYHSKYFISLLFYIIFGPLYFCKGC